MSLEQVEKLKLMLKSAKGETISADIHGVRCYLYKHRKKSIDQLKFFPGQDARVFLQLSSRETYWFVPVPTSLKEPLKESYLSHCMTAFEFLRAALKELDI
jgi:hypothetical protein